MSQFISDNILLLLLSLATFVSAIWLIYCKDRLKVNWWTCVFLSIAHTILGVTSVKIFAVLETFDLSKAGNMSLFGGLFFMPILYIIGSKIFHKDVRVVCDTFTPCMIFTLLCARFNCIFSGCCKGILLPGSSDIRWPTRELEIVFYIVLLLLILHKEVSIKTRGLLYPMYMTSYGIFRFFIEGFRTSDTKTFFHIAHIWALVALGLGLSIYFEINTNRRKTKYD